MAHLAVTLVYLI
jgi:hypothetical protein